MASFNKVIIAGNLTRDPDIRTAGSVKVADLRLAISETWRDKTSGQPREVTCFVDVVAWDKQADFCQQYFSKGKGMLVEGRLQMDEWTDKQTNEKRSKLRVRADRILFWGGPPPRQDGAAAPAATRTVAPAPAASGATAPEPPAFGGDDAGTLTQDDEALPF
ncbi:MAG TPA: single-stranded DNA-binding protein [Kiritimatiellia bacterium]|nr:single-stranded DNA-binding protein [Kiritimatiellia bacterium]HRU70998.1 single-stranded DNA-binding protein [Kiritimatiellia bacterium]